MNTLIITRSYARSRNFLLAILIGMIVGLAVAYIVSISQMTFSTAEATTLQWSSDTASWKGGW
jgi:xanthine/uracil permease